MIYNNIYIISSLIRAEKNEYKLGRHKGTSNELSTRYRTYLTKPIIYFFCPVKNYKTVEKIILQQLAKYRIKNDYDNKSEWICLELEKILQIITKIIFQYAIFDQEPNEKNVIDQKQNVIDQKQNEENIIDQEQNKENIIYQVPNKENAVDQKLNGENIIDQESNKEIIIDQVPNEENIINQKLNEKNVIEKNVIEENKELLHEDQKNYKCTKHPYQINCNLLPFGKGEINNLTSYERIEIFDSQQNPIEMLITNINLNQKKPEYHNIRIPNNCSRFGIIFTKNGWIIQKINVIMKTLLESKEADLIEIYNQIKGYISDEFNIEIKEKLDKLNDIIHSTNQLHIKLRKDLIARLKFLYVMDDSMQWTTVCIGNKKNTEIFLDKEKINEKKKEVVLDNMVKGIALIKKNKNITESKINMIDFLLEISVKKNTIKSNDTQLIKNLINDNKNDVDILKEIINELYNSAYLSKHTSFISIKKRISLSKKMNSMILDICN